MSNWEKLKKELFSAPDVVIPGKPLTSSRAGRHKRKQTEEDKDSSTIKRKSDKSAKRKKPLWFEGTISTDDRHSRRIHKSYTDQDRSRLVTGTDTSITKYIAMDCEMVTGSPNLNMLARCSIVNCYGNVLYDKYVTPIDKIVDYRTKYSGISREILLQKGTCEFSIVQKEVSDILKGRVLVGHALHHDLKALLLSHPSKHIRDTSRYLPYRKIYSKGSTPSLQKLAKLILGISIQQGAHDSIEDARVAMKLYQISRRNWERSLKYHREIKLKASSSNNKGTK